MVQVTCRGGEKTTTKLKALLDYKEEVRPFFDVLVLVLIHWKKSWLGKPKFLVDGIIYRYTVGNEEEEGWTKAKQVPADKIVGYLDGCWMKQIRYRLKGQKVCLKRP